MGSFLFTTEKDYNICKVEIGSFLLKEIFMNFNVMMHRGRMSQNARHPRMCIVKHFEP